MESISIDGNEIYLHNYERCIILECYLLASLIKRSHKKGYAQSNSLYLPVVDIPELEQLQEIQ